jgi:aryl-alcohol dehydrogenase-like predicted oxidoreductase
MQIPPRWQVGAEAAGDLPRPWHKFGGTAPLERSREIVRRAFELGITHFDLANNYP